VTSKAAAPRKRLDATGHQDPSLVL